MVLESEHLQVRGFLNLKQKFAYDKIIDMFIMNSRSVHRTHHLTRATATASTYNTNFVKYRKMNSSTRIRLFTKQL